ncbi:conserved membrane hypothetical protein [Vibrio chagasii]|nr:conserved membrane hypothetical protein [Vibrio chagasii]
MNPVQIILNKDQFMRTLLSECLHFTCSNFKSIFKIFGGFIITMSCLGVWLEHSFYVSENLWVYAVYLCVYSSIYTYLIAIFINFMASSTNGFDIERSVSWRVWSRLMIVYIIYSLIVLVGTIALIIPGLYLAARYSFVEFEAVLNNKSPLFALEKSWRDTKGITMKLIKISLLLGGLNFILNFVIGYIGEVYPTLQVATGILTSILSPVLLIFGSIVYFRVYITNVDAAEMPLGNEA